MKCRISQQRGECARWGHPGRDLRQGHVDVCTAILGSWLLAWVPRGRQRRHHHHHPDRRGGEDGDQATEMRTDRCWDGREKDFRTSLIPRRLYVHGTGRAPRSGWDQSDGRLERPNETRRPVSAANASLRLEPDVTKAATTLRVDGRGLWSGSSEQRDRTAHGGMADGGWRTAAQNTMQALSRSGKPVADPAGSR